MSTTRLPEHLGSSMPREPACDAGGDVLTGWPERPLGDMVSFFSGYAWKAERFRSAPPGLPIIRIQNVNSVRDCDFVYWPDAYDRRFLISKQDILLTLSGSFRVEIWPGPEALLNQRIVKLTPNEGIDRRWLLHAIRNVVGKIEKMGRHALVNNVALSDLRELKLRCPPLDEQRRIASILDKVNALRRLRGDSVAILKRLQRSIFDDTFGDMELYPRQPFGELVEETRIGLVRGASEFGDGMPYPYVRMNAITRDSELDLSTIRTTNASAAEAREYSLRPGDFLFNTRNSKELVGKVALWEEPGGFLFNNNIMRIRFSDRIEPAFALAAFASPSIQRELERRKTGTTSVFAIYWRDLKTLLLPVPPAKLQREFSAKMKQIDQLRASNKVHLAHLNSLFESLQHRAFQGGC